MTSLLIYWTYSDVILYSTYNMYNMLLIILSDTSTLWGPAETQHTTSRDFKEF